MSARVRQLFAAPVFDDDEKTGRARLLNAVLLTIGGAGLMLLVLAAHLMPRHVLLGVALGLAMLLGSAALIVLLRLGHVRLTGALCCVLLLGVTSAGALYADGIRGPVAMGYVVVVALAGVLFGQRGTVAVGLFSVAVTAAALYTERSGLVSSPAVPTVTGELLAYMALLVVAVFLTLASRRYLSDRLHGLQQTVTTLTERIRALEERDEALQKQVAVLQGTVDVSRQISSVLDPDELVAKVVELVREQFDLHHVGLFSVEDTGTEPEGAQQSHPAAVLRAFSGDLGRSMVEQEYRVFAGDGSPVGECLATGEDQVVRGVSGQRVSDSASLVPEAHSELVLPLCVQGDLIGVMTLQSGGIDAFDDHAVALLGSLAEWLASAWRNALLYREAQEAAARASRVVSQYIEENWETWVDTEETPSGYLYSVQQTGRTDDAWLQSMEQAVRAGEMVVEQDAPDGATLAVPLVQNGVVIGALGLRRPVGQAWSSDEQILVRSVSEQMTQALENRRLFQEARERARRELVLRRTSDRIRSQADLDQALQTAAEQMRRIVGATRVAIRLGTDPGPTDEAGA